MASKSAALAGENVISHIEYALSADYAPKWYFDYIIYFYKIGIYGNIFLKHQ